MSINIGFVSTRIAGTDGVSLEIAKLAEILRRLGHECCCCAGELDAEFGPGMLVPEMHFQHPEAVWIHDHSFGTAEAAPGLRERMTAMAAQLEQAVECFVEEFRVDVLFVQNALAIPMHVPLGVALTDFIARTGMPTLAHNHDLFWERERFLVNCIPDILERCFPPALPSVQHLAINSLAQEALWARKSIRATLLPNIFDYATAAPGLSSHNAGLRADLGLGDDHLLILQPTRVIARKGIELSIELVRRLREPQHRARLLGKEPVLVISHAAGDEGMGYLRKLQALADEVDVPLIYAADRFAAQVAAVRGQERAGRPRPYDVGSARAGAGSEPRSDDVGGARAGAGSEPRSDDVGGARAGAGSEPRSDDVGGAGTRAHADDAGGVHGGVGREQHPYQLWDAYVHADFVTYPSLIEGFGNALLETIYFRLPALVNRYDVYAADIGPAGFDLVEIDAGGDPANVGAMRDETVEAVIEAMMDPVRRRRMVEWNYHLARERYALEAVTPVLDALLSEATEANASQAKEKSGID